MKVQDLELVPIKPTRAQLLRSLIVYGAILGALFAAAMIGSHRSEQAHRALDTQYRHCVARYGFGGEHFPECLRGQR